MSNIANQRYECYSSGMDLNIREFPEDLVKSLKKEALDWEMTLRELVIEKCKKPYNESVSAHELKSAVERVVGTQRPKYPTTRSRKQTAAITASSAGSATTGMEEQGTVAVSWPEGTRFENGTAILPASNVMVDETAGHTLPGAMVQPSHAEGCLCLMCQFKRGEIK